MIRMVDELKFWKSMVYSELSTRVFWAHRMRQNSRSRIYTIKKKVPRFFFTFNFSEKNYGLFVRKLKLEFFFSQNVLERISEKTVIKFGAKKIFGRNFSQASCALRLKLKPTGSRVSLVNVFEFQKYFPFEDHNISTVENKFFFSQTSFFVIVNIF